MRATTWQVSLNLCPAAVTLHSTWCRLEIAAIFQETADNEKEHAKMWFKLLQGGEIKSTVENLQAAAEAVSYTHLDVYKRQHKQ